MTRILAEHHESVLIAMASLLQDAAKVPLVNFEIQRRMTDVPGNLLDLFFMERDAVKIQNWHTMNPMERFSFVGTLLRYRVARVSMQVDKWGRLEIDHPYVNILVKNPMPNGYANLNNYWKSMDDFCLLIGVCFYIAVLQNGGKELFEEPEEIHEFMP